MDGHDLLDAMEHIDPELIDKAATSPDGASRRWVTWYAVAACLVLCLAVLAGSWRLGRDWLDHGQTQTDGGETTGISEGTEPSEVLEIYYNQVTRNWAVTGLQVDAFEENLSPEEIAMVAPTVQADWMEISGAALYYTYDGWIYGVRLEIADQARELNAVVFMRNTSKDVYDDPHRIESEPVVETTFAELTFTGYCYDAGSSLRTEFERDGVYYSVEVCGGELSNMEAMIHDIMSCYAQTEITPNLRLLTPKNENYDHDILTDEQARADESFGAWMPPTIPEGFSAEVIRRGKSANEDILFGLWTHGDDELRWQVSRLTAYDVHYITAIEDKENYDLSLYPDPDDESIPSALRMIVKSPIFRIEELTQEAVRARVYISAGEDADHIEMTFGVLYGDVLVHVYAANVDPDWLYTQLQALK